MPFGAENCLYRAAISVGRAMTYTPKDAWSDPETNVERIEFLRVLEACLGKLPATTSRVFLMREWLELSSQEVCTEVNITAGNLRVLL